MEKWEGPVAFSTWENDKSLGSFVGEGERRGTKWEEELEVGTVGIIFYLKEAEVYLLFKSIFFSL